MSGSVGRRLSARSPRLSAFVTDYDRTLVPAGRLPGPRARRALHLAHRLGLATVIASGREYPVLRRLVGSLPELDAIVAENGAVVEAPIGARPWTPPAPTVREIRRRLRAGSFRSLRWGDIAVSVGIAEEGLARDLLSGVRATFTPNVDRVVILPPGVTKASGVQRALHALSLDSPAYAAIGDARNDLPMLRRAAISSAVANAEREVRDAVDFRTRSACGAGALEFVRGPVAELVTRG